MKSLNLKERMGKCNRKIEYKVWRGTWERKMRNPFNIFLLLFSLLKQSFDFDGEEVYQFRVKMKKKYNRAILKHCLDERNPTNTAEMNKFENTFQ